MVIFKLKSNFVKTPRIIAELSIGNIGSSSVLIIMHYHNLKSIFLIPEMKRIQLFYEALDRSLQALGYWGRKQHKPIISHISSALSRASRPCQKERRLWVRDCILSVCLRRNFQYRFYISLYIS